MLDLPDSAIHYADCARGVYIPQFFAESIKRDCVVGITDAQFDVLMHDPNADDCPEHYWDVWHEVLDRAVITDPRSCLRYTLYQDGDLWLLPEGWTPNEEEEEEEEEEI
jgi:hypothetical protein